jgi:FMN-dependent NADH-azoreductase
MRFPSFHRTHKPEAPMKLLHVDSSILDTRSVSRELTRAIVGRFAAKHPGLEVQRCDLAQDPLPHYAPANMPNSDPKRGFLAEGTPAPTDAARGEAVLATFLAADVVVIGAPMYNFGIPSQLKAWIDRLVIPGKTFTYGANGPEGLVHGKRVIVVLSRGGFYGPDSPAAPMEHAGSYLRDVFGFIGVSIETLVAEGTQVSPEARAAGLAAAHRQVAALQV